MIRIILSAVIIFCASTVRSDYEKAPVSAVKDLPRKLSDFLKAPEPGLYWMPGDIKHDTAFLPNNVLHVTNDKRVFLAFAYEGKVHCKKIFAYTEKLPELDALKSIAGKEADADDVYSLLKTDKRHLFTHGNENIIKTLSLGVIDKDDLALYVVFAPYGLEKDGLRGELWFCVKDGKTSFFPRFVYGTPWDVMSRPDEQSQRIKIPYAPVREITGPLSRFLVSAPEPGLYRLPGNIRLPLNVQYHGLRVTDDRQILLCPALKPWDELDYFYKDQCSVYTPSLPKVEAISKLADENGVKLDDFLKKMNWENCLSMRRSGDKKSQSARVRLFTWLESRICGKDITIGCDSDMILTSVMVQNGDYDVPDKDGLFICIDMRTGETQRDK
jgi:hypothetical protein